MIKSQKIVLAFLFIFFSLFIISCGPDGGHTDPADQYDRGALLTNWADNIIIPSFTDLSNKLANLKTASSTFTATPDESNLSDLRTKWLDAYVSWQSVDMFDIGKAEEITLRNYLNVYPLNETDMETSLLSGTYDLTSVNRQDKQGFSAVDYLIHGVADTDANIVAVYTDGTNGASYKNYLNDVVTRMESLVNQVLDDWNADYRDTFISRDGSSATESVNKLTNDFLFYYERYLRAGKIGFPAGNFSSKPLPEKVEARFREDVSKDLFLAGLNATQDFFNGKYYDDGTNSLGFDDYLTSLGTQKDGENLSDIINDQFNAARTQANSLSDNFVNQINSDNEVMTKTYDELQKNVIHLKVDMLQALNIRVDFVDTDGD